MTDPLRDYFLAIERRFIALRGAPLLLSPADWQVAQRWHRLGIPLDFVLMQLEEILNRHAERKSDRVSSLRYTARSIEGAWEELQGLVEMTVTRAEEAQPSERAEETSVEIGKALDRLARKVPSTLPAAAAVRKAIRAAAEVSAVSVEDRLRDIESEALSSVEASLDAEDRELIEKGVDARLEAVRDRLDSGRVAEVRERLRRRELRRHAGLPRLTIATS